MKTKNIKATKGKSPKTPSKKGTTRIPKDEKLRKKLKEAQTEITVLKDQLLRTAAELDNYRKRTEREIAMIIQNANKELIINLLPVVDDLERSLKISQKETTAEDLHKGVEFIYQKVMSLLQNQGLKPMESIGMPFDVDVHDALMQIEKKGADSNIIIEEHGKGYFLNDHVLRHAKVVVSK